MPSSCLLGTGIYPILCVLICDAASNLQATGPGTQRLLSGCVVAGAKHDNVGALEITISVELSEMRWGVLRDMVGLQR